MAKRLGILQNQHLQRWLNGRPLPQELYDDINTSVAQLLHSLRYVIMSAGKVQFTWMHLPCACVMSMHRAAVRAPRFGLKTLCVCMMNNRQERQGNFAAFYAFIAVLHATPNVHCATIDRSDQGATQGRADGTSLHLRLPRLGHNKRWQDPSPSIQFSRQNEGAEARTSSPVCRI